MHAQCQIIYRDFFFTSGFFYMWIQILFYIRNALFFFTSGIHYFFLHPESTIFFYIRKMKKCVFATKWPPRAPLGTLRYESESSRRAGSPQIGPGGSRACFTWVFDQNSKFWKFAFSWIFEKCNLATKWPPRAPFLVIRPLFETSRRDLSSQMLSSHFWKNVIFWLLVKINVFLHPDLFTCVFFYIRIFLHVFFFTSGILHF